MISWKMLISPYFQLDLEGTRIRRRQPLGESPKDVDSRTVYVVRLDLSVPLPVPTYGNSICAAGFSLAAADCAAKVKEIN